MGPALLFDLDGTMLHSDPLHAAVFVDLFAARGHQIDENFYLNEIHGRQNVDIFQDFFPNEDAQALSDAKESAFRDQLGTRATPTAGLLDLIAQAERQGWPMAVVTNAPRVNARHMLGAVGLADRFDTVIIGDDCTAGKPDPAPYLVAMQALKVAPQNCIAFEDSPSGVHAADAAGALTIGLRSSLSDAQLRAAGAIASIADFNDPSLPTLLARVQTPDRHTQGAPFV